MKAVLGVVALMAMIGLVGSSERHSDLAEATANTCTQSAQQANRWADQCQGLIKQLEAKYPNDEVLSDNEGNYWVEVKGK